MYKSLLFYFIQVLIGPFHKNTLLSQQYGQGIFVLAVVNSIPIYCKKIPLAYCKRITIKFICISQLLCVKLCMSLQV